MTVTWPRHKLRTRDGIHLPFHEELGVQCLSPICVKGRQAPPDYNLMNNVFKVG